jgi:hypothetical protein
VHEEEEKKKKKKKKKGVEMRSNTFHVLLI